MIWSVSNDLHTMTNPNGEKLAYVQKHPAGHGWFFHGQQIPNSSNNGKYFPSWQTARKEAEDSVSAIKTTLDTIRCKE